jgi:chromosome segregation ATPase
LTELKDIKKDLEGVIDRQKVKYSSLKEECDGYFEQYKREHQILQESQKEAVSLRNSLEEQNQAIAALNGQIAAATTREQYLEKSNKNSDIRIKALEEELDRYHKQSANFDTPQISELTSLRNAKIAHEVELEEIKMKVKLLHSALGPVPKSNDIRFAIQKIYCV